jgi:hypothetical protein
MLVPYLETYLADHRSGVAALRGTAAASDALWLVDARLPDDR